MQPRDGTVLQVDPRLGARGVARSTRLHELNPEPRSRVLLRRDLWSRGRRRVHEPVRLREGEDRGHGGVVPQVPGHLAVLRRHTQRGGAGIRSNRSFYVRSTRSSSTDTGWTVERTGSPSRMKILSTRHGRSTNNGMRRPTNRAGAPLRRPRMRSRERSGSHKGSSCSTVGWHALHWGPLWM